MDGDQFSYCAVCKINHNQKRKHIFTNKHKTKLKIITKRFSSKIKIYKGYFENPVIQKKSDDDTKNFWCYYCNKEINLHVTDFHKTILYGGFHEHLGSNEHHKATETFFKDNGIESKYKTQYIISELDLLEYKKKILNLVEKYEKASSAVLQNHAKEIEETERSRHLLLIDSEKTPFLYRTVKNRHGILQNPLGFHDNIRIWRGGIVKYPVASHQLIASKYNRVKKTSVKHTVPPNTVTNETELSYKHLTKVNLKFDKKQGNIFTGAIPPWELPDEPSEDVKDVGPSLKLYKDHLKRKEKAKLNPNRVGANFDHTTKNSENWLPSFGRVWNDGARWKSRKQYRDEVKLGNKRKFSTD